MGLELGEIVGTADGIRVGDVVGIELVGTAVGRIVGLTVVC